MILHTRVNLPVMLYHISHHDAQWILTLWYLMVLSLFYCKNPQSLIHNFWSHHTITQQNFLQHLNPTQWKYFVIIQAFSHQPINAVHKTVLLFKAGIFPSTNQINYRRRSTNEFSGPLRVSSQHRINSAPVKGIPMTRRTHRRNDYNYLY